MRSTTIHCCLFDGADELDVLGPYEVFSCAQRSGAPIEPTLVGLDSTAPIRANHGTTIEPQATLGTPDVVVVPGGGWSDEKGGVRVQVEDGALSDRLVQLHEEETVIASVCTGAMVLAHAGLLDGKAATTHDTAKEDLEAFEAVTVSDDRYVDAGDVLTAGGVTSGIDLALHLTERLGDETTAETVASEIAHERARSV
ncbi:DJ-1/PfpI family protein [Halocatena halophila]|uniref:DJ-1/PfpI family protein n=1 Tax=Halocatena halophila TaxID=2814576 RepID=UPI002ED016CD